MPPETALIIAPIATIISVPLGTPAAVDPSLGHVPGQRAIMAVLISPMIVPVIIPTTEMFFSHAPPGHWMEANVGLSQSVSATFQGILAYAVLGIALVVITVTAALEGLGRSLTRAGAD